VADWLSRYWFSVTVGVVVLAVAAYRVRPAARPVIPAEILEPKSLATSALLALVPAALLLLAPHQSRAAGFLFQGAALLALSAMFFAASRASKHVALFALICWLSTSKVRPSVALWTRLFGALFFVCAVGVFATAAGI
jgi:hypothetical protein